MTKRVLITILATSLISSITFAASHSSKFSTAIDGIRKKNGVPALAAMEIRDGKVVAYAFTGVRKTGSPAPIKISDQFHLGSDTKAMTATMIGLLIDRSKLRWDMSLGELFPGLRMNDAYKKVTVAMLGAHRAGLPENPTDRTFWKSLWAVDPVKGRREILKKVLAAPPAFPPGSKFSYSNLSYVILGSIIEKVSGISYERFIRKNLFDPLAMKSCGFGPMGTPSANPPDEPWGHYFDGNSLVPAPPNPDADNPSAYNSAARIHCSLRDWGKFLQMHVDGSNGRSYFLRPETFSKLHTAYPGQNYTFGGWIKAKRDWAGGIALTHEGSNTMNVALVWLAPLRNVIFMSASNAPLKLGRPAVNAAIDYMIETFKAHPGVKFPALQSRAAPDEK